MLTMFFVKSIREINALYEQKHRKFCKLSPDKQMILDYQPDDDQNHCYLEIPAIRCGATASRDYNFGRERAGFTSLFTIGAQYSTLSTPTKVSIMCSGRVYKVLIVPLW